jgi:hypothetical protein
MFSLFTLELSLLIQLLSFAYNWFGLFVDCATMFATLKGRKWCSLVGFLSWEGVDVVTYLIASKPQLS